MKGVVKSFSRLKGYGFIQSKELEHEVWNEEKGHDFYLSVEEIEYCGLKEIYQDEKENDLEMMEEMDEIDK